MTVLFDEAAFKGVWPVGEALAVRLQRAGPTWRRILAYLAVTLTPLIAFVGDLGLAPLVALLGIGSLVFLGRRRNPDVGFAIMLSLVLSAVSTMVWSIGTPIHPNFRKYKEIEGLIGLKLIFELCLYGAFAVAMQDLQDKAASRAGGLLAVGLAALAGLLLLESLDGAALYTFIRTLAHQRPTPDIALRDAARGCYVAAVLFWPAAVRLRLARRTKLLALLVIGLAGAGLFFRVDAPMLALAASVPAFLLVYRFGRPAVFALGLVAVAYLVLAPLIAHILAPVFHPATVVGAVAKQSWVERIDIWRFTAAEIVRNPLRGYGLDASRAFSPDIPVHPHDAALQLWLELGVPGVSLACMLVAWLFSRIAQCSNRLLAAAGAAAASVYLVIGALSFGVWQEWWLALGVLAVMAWRFLGRTLDLEARDAAALAVLPSIG